MAGRSCGSGECLPTDVLTDLDERSDSHSLRVRQWTGQEWATQNPIVMRDPEVGAVRIRAFGTYAFHVDDPKIFLQQLVLTDPSFETVHSPQKHRVDYREYRRIGADAQS